MLFTNWIFCRKPIPMILTKVIELYETKNSRHSTMIVGESNTAKSVTWRTLQNTMTAMKNDGKPGFNVVHVHPINPKALSLGELYGEYNLSTGEWLDGVISSIMRKTCSSKEGFTDFSSGYEGKNFTWVIPRFLYVSHTIKSFI